VVDVTGWLGGYNFQWAWSSGFAAGSHCWDGDRNYGSNNGKALEPSNARNTKL
jgi:hypothetical protein